MKLIQTRKHRRRQAPRIAISEAEITADLNYPAGREGTRRAAAADRRRSAR